MPLLKCIKMNKIDIMTTRFSLLKTIIKYTVPIIFSSLFQLFFNAADLMVVGRFCGSQSVGAVGATGALITLIVNMFIGLSVGAGICASHAYGAKDSEALNRTVHTAIVVSVVSGLILTIIGVAYSEKLLKIMNTPENILELSTVYMKIYFGGIVFSMIYNYVAYILRAIGDTKKPLIFLVLSGILNVILNLIFVTVCNLDVAGVALATVISQGFCTFLALRALIVREDACKLCFRRLGIYKSELFKMINVGVPVSIQSCLFSISNVAIQSSVNSLGDAFITGMAAASSINGFIYVILNSFGQTTVNFVGQGYGAKDCKRIMDSVWICFLCIMTFGISCCVITYLVSPWLLSFYITDSSQAVANGILCMKYVCLSYFLCGLMDITTGALNGLGASFITMLVSILGVVGVRLYWIYVVFAANTIPELLLASYPASWFITFVCQFISFLIIYKIKKKELCSR